MAGSASPSRERLRAAGVVLVLQTLASVLAGLAYLSRDYSLAANPNWTASKTTVARPLMGAEQFVAGRNATTHSKLDLGAWYGYQELILNRPISSSATDISFDFALDDDAYLNFIFNKSPQGFAGIRLSRNEHFPHAFFVADELGRFVDKRPFDLGRQLGHRTRHHGRVRFEGQRAVLEIDGREAHAFAARLEPGTSIGFRGSLARAIIDDIVVRGRGGSVFQESFFDRQRLLPVTAAAFGILSVLSVGWFLRARRGRRGSAAPRRALLSLMTLHLVLVVCLGATFAYLRLLRKQTYPVEADLKAAEQEWLQEEVAPEVSRRIRRTYSPEPSPSTYRILLIGTSQTWGSGAAREEHTIRAQLQRLLDGRVAGHGSQVECINAAVPGMDSESLIEPWYLNEWIDLAPHLVVVNLCHNDPREGLQLTRNLEVLAKANRQREIPTLFVAEAASMENENRIQLNHDQMQRVAREHGLGFLNMHAHIRERSDTGFVWWDGIHLTSHGQLLVAEKLAEVIWRDYLAKRRSR